MPSGFDAARPVAQLYGAFAKVKQLVADFWANEKFLSRAATVRTWTPRPGKTSANTVPAGTSFTQRCDNVITGAA
jgi:hypothetical protein